MSEFVDENYRAKCSEKTLQTNSNGFFMDFVDLVKDRAGDNWINEKFGLLKNDNDRIRCVYESLETKEVVTKLLSNVKEVYRKKDGTISILKRLEADSAAESGDLNKSLLLYSQSILRAPKTGECNNYDSGLSLSLSLWGRSKVLVSLQEYPLGLTDIQQALKEHLPAVFKPEAYWKMGICYKALGEDKKAKVAFDLAEKLSENAEKIEEIKKDRNLDVKWVGKPKVEDLNNFVSSKLNVANKEGLGRYVVTKNKVKTGETLVVEAPFASCLLPDKFGTHCHHCYVRLKAPIGCPDCSNVAFCTPSCRDSALSSYHIYECKYLDLLIGSGMSVLSHTALRMITQQNIDKTLEMYKNKSNEKIFSLCTNSDKREPGDFLQRTLMAAFLLRCLQKSKYFNTEGDNVTPTEDEFIVGEMLLYFLQMLQFNAHEVFELLTLPDYDLKGSKLSYIGVGIYPSVALFNHDCFPAVTRYFNGKDIVIKAVRPLKKNDVVAENYGPIFSRKPLKERQTTLSSRYWFKCECDACVFDWPTLDGLENATKRLRCTTNKCKGCFTLPLSNNSVVCPKCKKTINLNENIRILECCEKKYEEGFEFMLEKDYRRAVDVFCSTIDDFYRVACVPHKSTHLAQESLQISLASYGNTSNTLKIN